MVWSYRERLPMAITRFRPYRAVKKERRLSRGFTSFHPGYTELA